MRKGIRAEELPAHGIAPYHSGWMEYAALHAGPPVFPGCGNEIIYLIKYSSLAYLVTCMELMGEGKVIASDTFRFFEVFAVVGLYYLAMVSIAQCILNYLEARTSIPGFQTK